MLLSTEEDGHTKSITDRPSPYYQGGMDRLKVTYDLSEEIFSSRKYTDYMLEDSDCSSAHRPAIQASVWGYDYFPQTLTVNLQSPSAF